MAQPTISVTLDGTNNTIVISDDANISPDVVITKQSIKHVGAMYQVNVPYYPYPTKCMILFEFSDNTRLSIEAQSISNQNTWNDGTQSELEAAVTAINAWLS